MFGHGGDEEGSHTDTAHAIFVRAVSMYAEPFAWLMSPAFRTAQEKHMIAFSNKVVQTVRVTSHKLVVYLQGSAPLEAFQIACRVYHLHPQRLVKSFLLGH